MGLQDIVSRRAIDLQTQLDRLDAQYAATRASMLAQLKHLQDAQRLITPEIQAVVDALGVEVKG